MTTHGGEGRLVLITGPSGAGKDTMIAYVRDRLADRPDVVFPRRIVTRAPDATETPDTMDERQFRADDAAGAFLVSWRAHGLSYGVPGRMRGVLEAGHQVVVNVSRGVVAGLRARFNCAVVRIDAPPSIRRERLANRGREDDAEIEARIARAVPAQGEPDISLLNEGPPSVAGEPLLRFIREWPHV